MGFGVWGLGFGVWAPQATYSTTNSSSNSIFYGKAEFLKIPCPN